MEELQAQVIELTAALDAQRQELAAATVQAPLSPVQSEAASLSTVDAQTEQLTIANKQLQKELEVTVPLSAVFFLGN